MWGFEYAKMIADAPSLEKGKEVVEKMKAEAEETMKQTETEIKETYGTIEETEIFEQDEQQ